MEILFFIVGIFLQWTLEVLGAGGAVWGMSEVWHLRGGTNANPTQSNDDFRIPANIVFVLGFIRMFFRYSENTGLKTAIVDPHDWIKKSSGASTDATTKIFEFFGFIMGFYLQWDLEVAGAGGACWGMSEVFKFRGGKTSDPAGTNNDWRWVANTVFCIGLLRMAQKYCPDHAVHVAMNAPNAWIKSLQLVEKPQSAVEMQAGQQDGL